MSALSQARLPGKLPEILHRHFQVFRPGGGDGHGGTGDGVREAQFLRVQRGAEKERAFFVSGLEPVIRFDA